MYIHSFEMPGKIAGLFYSPTYNIVFHVIVIITIINLNILDIPFNLDDFGSTVKMAIIDNRLLQFNALVLFPKTLFIHIFHLVLSL